MATIRKRTWQTAGETRSAWVCDYVDGAAARRLKTFTTRKAADAWLVQARGQVAAGTHTPDSTSVTVAEAADRWLRRGELDGLERATVRTYREHVRNHIVPRLGGTRLARLTGAMVQEFADYLLAVVSRPMAAKVLVSLKAVLKDARRRGLVAQNVAELVTVRVSSRHRERIVAPTKAEVRAMLEAVPAGRWRALLVTAIFTGLRSSELRGLRWSDVDFDAKLIQIRQRADENGIMGPPKSAAGRREVPLAPFALNTIREWRLASQGELVFGNDLDRPEPLTNIRSRCFCPLQLRCGIVDEAGAPKYGFHALRHFTASWFIEQGFSPKRVQTILGHASIAMTFDTYGHLFPTPEDDQRRLAAGELSLIG
jgi:integrase